MVDARQMLSPKQVAAAIGASESSLKRWADAGKLQMVRTPGGHRRIALPDAVRFIREAHLAVVRPDLLGLPVLSPDPDDATSGRELGEVLFQRLMAGEAEVLPAWAVEAYLEGASIAEICDTGLREALKRIGHVWREDSRGIFLEHRATDQAVASLHLLMNLTAQMDVDEKVDRRPVAIGGALSTDPHIIPSLMAKCVLTDVGYRGMNLGPDVPIDSLLEATQFYDAQLAWLSITSTEIRPPSLKSLNALAEELSARDCALVIGGRRVDEIVGPKHANLTVCHHMTELAAFARGLLRQQV